MPLCWVPSFTQRGVSVGAKNVPDRVRFTRALLEGKDLSMWFCLPLCMWVSGLSPSSEETAPEKRSPRTAFPQAGKRSSQQVGQASHLRASTGSQPACVWKPLFGRNGLASPKGDLQICSEDRNSRGRVEVPDCPLPALQRYSLIIALLSMKEQASGICGEGFEFGFLQTAKAYSNENSLSGKGEACRDSQAVF